MTRSSAAAARGGDLGRAPAEPARPRAVEPWPQGVSREPTMRISDVLADLGTDFPTVTPSKLRFLEEQGLVRPRRTPGGYRMYSPADVERLRFVLRQQRDRYLPLRVIGEQLDALDSGAEQAAPTPRLATRDGEHTDAGETRIAVSALAGRTGADPALVDALVEHGVLHVGPSGHVEPTALDVVRAAVALAEHGVDVRHLRAFRTAADRQVSLVEQIVAPLRSQRAVVAQARAANLAGEVGELCATLHTALVRAGVGRLAP